MHMRAAFMSAVGHVAVGDFVRPSPADGEVLVQMHYASICGSDVHIVYDGFHNPDLLGRPGYPGHEGVGTVVESTVRNVPVGTKVLTVPHGQNGACFAEYQVVDAAQVIPLDDRLDLRRALLAQQLGTTVFGMKKFLPLNTPREDLPTLAVVIGAGSSGLFFLQHLIDRGVKVIVSDLNAKRLEVASRIGAVGVVHEPRESIIDVVAERTHGSGVDLVVEAVGLDLTRGRAVEIVRPHGTIGFFGYPENKGLAPFPVERAFRKSLTMHWINGTQSEPGLSSFRTAIDLIETGRIDIDYCTEKVYDLEDIDAALTSARAQGDGYAKIGIALPGALT
uniref:zinc-binding dehydrogenase n=1 Tax=unclassified Rhodococcus (in: high G+C Gram-positive bacteria) TaxID=192944 RepID=UPI0015963253|nr:MULTISPECIES: zinc-binding dehydrogenase [unclassified Rhodococcus (in: high G+C Gram-positive bacteria)]